MPLDPAGVAPIIKIEDAGYTTSDGKQLVSGISASFNRGSFSAIVGHNGSGKSTSLKMIANIAPPTSGKILLNQSDISLLSTRDFAKQVAYLAQEPGDGADYTVEELVALGRYPWHGPFGRLGTKDHEAIERAISLTGLGPLRHQAVRTLSGGERQRAWIAVTLAQQTQCLLLDEPISALDLAHQFEILLLLEKLAHEDGLCVIAVLHDINLSARFCDHIVAFRKGRLIVDASPKEMMRPETLRQIFGLEMLVHAHPGSGHPMAFANV